MPAPRFHLAKTDPETYSISNFELDKKTVWDGVTNAQAVQSIRNMQKGDKVFIYHSMGESAIVGLARVDSAPRPDPNNPKSAVVDLTLLRRLDPPTTLHAIKESGLFADFALVRQSRLSTMPCPDEFVDWVRARYPKIKL
jgi:predicted RNA-binding protein with PUA-like domain